MSSESLDDTHVDLEVRKAAVEGKRLDQYVVSRLPELSRSLVQRLIDDGALLVNEGRVKASHKVRPGDRISIDLPRRFSSKPVPQEIPLNILYEDDDIVLLDKQADFIVHPGRGRENWSGTLTNALQHHFDRLSTIGGEARPGIIHRLDRDTTGIMVVAKNDEAHKEIAMQFELRKVHKEYRALCYGAPELDNDIIDRPIGVHPQVREKMAIRNDPAISRSAVTFYEVLERFDGFSFVRLVPKTGRTHQLRVHLSSIGVPIIADKPYAGRSRLCLSELSGQDAEDPEAETPLIERQALHAFRLRFWHPGKKSFMDLSVPLPQDMSQTLEMLREHRSLAK
ncbi:Pseudouridine synthase [Planctomycetes bacterium Pan216]|uniref:Pseudouridine synthase n=1 Tax=Kolteria novifilia TaxID=2527975 RepID=A0A518B948_9BACT|nr:Pseudouridine synthase [Planctomycetes bacterium Pan216]